MPGVVKCRPEQVIHGCIHDRKVAQWGRLQVAHACQEHPRIADQKAPRLEQELEWSAAEQAADRQRILMRIDGFLVAVADPDAAAEVDMLELYAFSGKPVNQR